jgi:hypothetical protein
MTKRSNTAKGTFGDDLQCVAPDHMNLMGDVTGADVIVTDGVANESAVAPKDGIVEVSLPSGLAVRMRIGDAVTAVATDALRVGPMVWWSPIAEGEVVSIIGDGGAGIATVCMAK